MDVGGAVTGTRHARGVATRIYSVVFSALTGRRISDATNGFRIFRASLLHDPQINLDQRWLDSYELEPYLLYKVIRGPYRLIEVPCTVRYHSTESFTKMRGLRDWWRLFRPALLLRLGLRR